MKNLSRNELKKVMGGSTICACDAAYNCVCGDYNHCSLIAGTACLDCNTGKTCAVAPQP
jgi:hypothetical protein